MTFVMDAVTVCATRAYPAFFLSLSFFSLFLLPSSLFFLLKPYEAYGGAILFEKHSRGGSKRPELTLRPIVAAIIAEADL